MEGVHLSDNTLNGNSVVSGECISERIGYILLGGGKESMEKRVNAVAKEIKDNPDRPVVITGFESEIKQIEGFLSKALNDNGKGENINLIGLEKVRSYDTRSNIMRIMKKMPEFLENLDRCVISTSKSHGRRVEKVFEWLKGFQKQNDSDNLPKVEEDRREVIFNRKLPGKGGADKFVLELLNSGEKEVGYAGLGEGFYNTEIGAKLIQYASIPLRPFKFLKEYLLPEIKESLKCKNGGKSMKNYLLSIFQSNQRYA